MDLANQRPGGGGRPRLRCPACSTMVDLPATTCPKCRTNLRTGYTPQDNSGLVRGRLILGGLALLLALAAAAMFFDREEVYLILPADSSAPPPASELDLDEAVDTVQSISESQAAIGGNPAQAKPILDLTRKVAEEAGDKHSLAEGAAGSGGGE